MSTLYITEDDSILRKVDERIKVIKDKVVLLDIPLIKVTQIAVTGRVTVTGATVRELAERKIGLCYLTNYGRYVGRMEGEFSKNNLLRIEQYRAYFDPVKPALIARQMITGKLSNQRVYILRVNRDNPNSDLQKAADEISHCIKKVGDSEDIDQIRGYEGNGAASYFGVFDLLLKNPDFSFAKRVKRPPTDPVNALLSFGYSILRHDIGTALNIVGFDPYLGYLHTDRYGRPSLSLDLMEEFRPLIVDSTVLTCINKNILKPDDFKQELGGTVVLTNDGRAKFLKAFEERKQTEFKHPIFNYKVSYQRCFEIQARILAKYLTGEIEAYQPLITR